MGIGRALWTANKIRASQNPYFIQLLPTSILNTHLNRSTRNRELYNYSSKFGSFRGNCQPDGSMMRGRLHLFHDRKAESLLLSYKGTRSLIGFGAALEKSLAWLLLPAGCHTELFLQVSKSFKMNLCFLWY